MEHGFYHPSRGYWQTITTPSPHILGSYPDGTVEVPLKPGPNYKWENGQWVQVAVEPPTAQDLLDYLGRKRVEVEEGGIVLNGVTIATDRAVSQVKIAAAWAKAKADPEFSISNWKVAPGVFVPLNNATIIAIGDAVTAHIQACFDKEAELAAKIQADPPEITTYQEIDEADWPSNG